MLPARVNIFYSKAAIKPTGEAKVAPKIINLSSEAVTERQMNLLRRKLKFTRKPKPQTIRSKK